MQHHPVFSHFRPFDGEVPGGFQLEGFLGSMARQEFRSEIHRPGAIKLKSGYPEFDEDYFEWIALLESVVDASGSYTMIELGAGFGRWSVRASQALKQYNSKLPFRLIAVEPEPKHFEWLRLHFSDNGLDPAKHSLIHAAVSDEPGEVSFYMTDGRQDAGQWYGQRLTKDHEVLEQIEEETYCGFVVHRFISGYKSISVPGVSLGALLKDASRVDLVDIDIQGEEGSAIRSSVDLLNARVKRLHIGTHSREIEIGLRELLSAHGWICQVDYSQDATHQTPFGDIAFQDGVQSWLNPRLCGSRWSPRGLVRTLR